MKIRRFSKFSLEWLFLRVMPNMHDQVLLSHELLSAMRADKVLDALVNLFVIEKRRDEPVALTADVTNVKVCLLHVLPHVNLIDGK